MDTNEYSGVIDVIVDKSLKMLAAKPRAVVAILMALGKGDKDYEGLVRECNSVGLKCNILDQVLARLSFLEIIENRGGERYGLSDYGYLIYNALMSIIDESRGFLSKALSGSIDENNVLSFVSIIIASLFNLVSVVDVNDTGLENGINVNEYYEEVMESIHAFVSSVVTNTIIEAAKREPYLRLVIQGLGRRESNISDKEIY